jgi:hypothetical protein
MVKMNPELLSVFSKTFNYLLLVGVAVSVSFAFTSFFSDFAGALFSLLLLEGVLTLFEDDSLDDRGVADLASDAGFDSDLLVTVSGVRLDGLSVCTEGGLDSDFVLTVAGDLLVVLTFFSDGGEVCDLEGVWVLTLSFDLLLLLIPGSFLSGATVPGLLTLGVGSEYLTFCSG